MDFKKIVDKQRNFFLTDVTKSIDFRIEALKKLKKSLLDNVGELVSAFKKDYNKCEFDVISTEVSMVQCEINYMLKHLKSLERPRRQKISLLNFPSRGYIVNEPHGVSLIIAPWNYPLQLALSPLVGAIAGGNTAVVKPSINVPNVSKTIKKILSVFDDEYITTIVVGREQTQGLFDQKFDFVFFTGGINAGRKILEQTSKYLTPTVLELGGKSPCIVDEDADIDLAAKRITWGKYLNAGQTCVAPDHIFVHKSVKEQFVENVKKYIKEFYYVDGKLTKDFPYLVNDKQVERIRLDLQDCNIIVGGKFSGRCLEPTVVDNLSFDDKIMQEEIFAPVMPIIQYDDITQIFDRLKTVSKPLALYYFGKDKDIIKHINTNCSFGGGCINDTIMHLTEEHLPFGGVGESGKGNYHGSQSFKIFTHAKSILQKGKAELKIKYPPYTKKKTNFVKRFFGIK